ncbi:acyl-CoA synthetase MbcS [Tepidibacillus marianensis]|uniref:acyl-CoA synthetase MbcS n=1 Tax=Tepidibacillus marianensis TaxID=3131995 RepID=UPI0030D45B0B
MNIQQLIAPEQYNLTQEIEQFVSDKIALKWMDEEGLYEEITYAQLIRKANQLANALTKLGLTKGDRVLVMMPRLIFSYVVYLATLKAGLVIIPSSEMLRAKDISYRIQHSEAKAILAYSEFYTEIDAITDPIPSLEHKLSYGKGVSGWLSAESLMKEQSDIFATVQTSKDDLAFLSYTSGTTGFPKGVMHSHGWAYAHLRIASDLWLDIHENDLVWATAGPGWQKWVWSPFLSILGKGATGFVYHGRFEPHKYLTLLQGHDVNVLCCTPTEYRLMAKVNGLNQYQLPHLRSAVSAGEPLNREVIDVFRSHFHIEVRDGYGQTEATLLVGTLKDMLVKPGSMGKPTVNNSVEIINEKGEPVSAGEEGDIAVHRDLSALFKGYYKDQEKTLSAFRGDFYITGDRAKKDKDGYYWFEGRRDDIIISSGYTIGPFEVEDALMKHSAVKECAVVASPDEIRGHVVKAFIILKDEFTGDEHLEHELKEHVKKLTAPYKYPRRIEFVQDLPKTNSGKIRRVELRELEEMKYKGLQV